MIIFFLNFLFIGLNSSANLSCDWIATVNQPVEKIINEIEKKAGKKPTLSCGAGTDFKVCHSCIDKPSKEQWRLVQETLAEPTFRKWHTTWHENTLLQAEQNAKKSNGRFNNDQLQGENFFLTHREIVRSVQANLAANNLPCISGWSTLPSTATDKIWPNTEAQIFNSVKEKCERMSSETATHLLEFNREFDQIRKQLVLNRSKSLKELNESDIERDEVLKKRIELIKNYETEMLKIKNQTLLKYDLTKEVLNLYRDCPDVDTIKLMNTKQNQLSSQVADFLKEPLKNKSLGLIGSKIEKDWHSAIHENYNSIQPDFCDLTTPAVECDDMTLPFSSHVNIHFYKTHGYIDLFVDKWLKENQYEIASTKCHSKKNCYQWKGTFIGEVPDYVNGTGCSLNKKTIDHSIKNRAPLESKSNGITQ